MIVTIHQPEHLVWLGLLDKISQADVFVIFDSVQYKKDYFENRNKIKTPKGWSWVIVPVKKMPLQTNIVDIEISYETDWIARYLGQIRANYQKAPFFREYYPKLESILLKKHKFLVDLNIELLMLMLDCFGIKNKKIIRSSTLGIPSDIHGSQLCLEVCKRVGATRYISGPLGKEYLDQQAFKDANIELTFHEFQHPVYPQLHGDFLPYMSAVDALFSLGREAKNLIFQS